MTRSRLSRWRELEPEKRRAALEAAAWLAIVSAAVRFSPFRTTMRLAAWPLSSRSPRDADAQVARVAWAIRAAARRARFRAVCIEQGLAAQVMLRRRGIAGRLHYGVRKRPDGSIDAHVWVTVDGRPVVGCETAGNFTPLAMFPADPGG